VFSILHAFLFRLIYAKNDLAQLSLVANHENS